MLSNYLVISCFDVFQLVVLLLQPTALLFGFEDMRQLVSGEQWRAVDSKKELEGQSLLGPAIGVREILSVWECVRVCTAIACTMLLEKTKA